MLNPFSPYSLNVIDIDLCNAISKSVQLQEDFACCQPHFVKVLDKFRRIWAAAATHVIRGSLEPAISFRVQLQSFQSILSFGSAIVFV